MHWLDCVTPKWQPDVLIGGTGQDLLLGGDGDDSLDGGLANCRTISSGNHPMVLQPLEPLTVIC